MRRAKARLGLIFLIVAAPAAMAGDVSAAVVIKTFRVAICVTDTKHPDGCKSVAADGRVVVSEDALQGLEGELGQGATIMQATGVAKPSGGQERRHRHSDHDQTSPPQ